MNPMLRDLDQVTAVTLRRIKGRLEVMLAEARIEQRQASSVREMVAAVSVVHKLEEAVAAFREALATKKRQSGWRRLDRTRTGTSPRDRLAAAAPRRPDRARSGRTPAVGPATVGKDAGVAGVQPPPSMGQGRPALPGAGRAASDTAQADGQRAVSVKSAPHPANPSFCSQNERISDPSDKQGDIHYAQLWRRYRIGCVDVATDYKGTSRAAAAVSDCRVCGSLLTPAGLTIWRRAKAGPPRANAANHGLYGVKQTYKTLC